MLYYPEINPVAISLGPLKVHWYGLMYLVAFAGAWGLGVWRAKKSQGVWTTALVSDLIFYVAIGAVVGGRIGYMFIYDFPALLDSPLNLLKIWQGGMAFHGGFIGVLLAMALFCKFKHKHFGDVADFVAPLVPFGLAAGRIGNFINGELWGRVSDVAWAMWFPNAGPYPRHPSQLYEFLAEGVLLFIIVWWFSGKPRPRYAVSGLFALAYGVARFCIEFFREPDWQIGFIAFEWLTMGQLLSIPMVLVGAGLMIYAYRCPGAVVIPVK
jgi:phosphatidylglycerol:prolipoprotein diacylglycerol transferase